jgi:hypothetical protein
MRGAHDHAHMIGMRGFDPARPVGETFSTCRVDFQSGCYHGVIQAYLTSLDTVGPAEVAALCSEVQAVRESMWIRFQCAHGLGHGLTMRYQHDLPRGLAGCDLLADGWDRESCYGGAFMENVIATDEHHMPMRITASNASEKPMDHSAMAHEHGTPAPEFKRIDPDDPQYPCSIVGEAYKRACYGMQTAVMLGQNVYSFEKTARSCDQAPATYRTTCYQSMGTNISGYTLRDTKKSIELCSLGTTRYQPWCIFGVVKNFIDVTSRAEDGFAFCEALPEGSNRLMCYHAVGEQVYVLNALPDDRSKACERASGVDRDACRLGAGVGTVVPEGLPRASQVEME